MNQKSNLKIIIIFICISVAFAGTFLYLRGVLAKPGNSWEDLLAMIYTVFIFGSLAFAVFAARTLSSSFRAAGIQPVLNREQRLKKLLPEVLLAAAISVSPFVYNVFNGGAIKFRYLTILSAIMAVITLVRAYALVATWLDLNLPGVSDKQQTVIYVLLLFGLLAYVAL